MWQPPPPPPPRSPGATLPAPRTSCPGGGLKPGPGPSIPPGSEQAKHSAPPHHPHRVPLGVPGAAPGWEAKRRGGRHGRCFWGRGARGPVTHPSEAGAAGSAAAALPPGRGGRRGRSSSERGSSGERRGPGCSWARSRCPSPALPPPPPEEEEDATERQPRARARASGGAGGGGERRGGAQRRGSSLGRRAHAPAARRPSDHRPSALIFSSLRPSCLHPESLLPSIFPSLPLSPLHPSARYPSSPHFFLFRSTSLSPPSLWSPASSCRLSGYPLSAAGCSSGDPRGHGRAAAPPARPRGAPREGRAAPVKGRGCPAPLGPDGKSEPSARLSRSFSFPFSHPAGESRTVLC